MSGRTTRQILHRRDGRKSIRKVGFLPLPVGEGRGEGISAHVHPHPNPLPQGRGDRSSTNFERYLLLSCNRRTENRAFAPEYCGEKAWPGMTASQLDAKDRKSTRLNSSHVSISYAVFCLKKNNERID